jgi:acyl-CoA thioesterase-1
LALGIAQLITLIQAQCAMRFLSVQLVLAVSGLLILIQSTRADAASSSSTKTVVFVGDSITEGYGVRQEQAFPAIAGELLRKKNHDVKIVNGGISGSVSADADARIKWFLKLKPDVIVLELGGNDALKGTPIAQIEKNLDKALQVAQDAHIKTLILGMRIYTNFGPDYTKKFTEIYPRLAKAHKAALIPFLLEDVALKPTLMQADQKHPNVPGHAKVAERVASELEKLL